jgi:hypothetical protein
MTSENSNQAPDSTQLPPQKITDRLRAVDEGDELAVNDREASYQVVETDRYSVVVRDDQGNSYTVAQNLQTGGWSLHEDVWWVSAVDADEASER